MIREFSVYLFIICLTIFGTVPALAQVSCDKFFVHKPSSSIILHSNTGTLTNERWTERQFGLYASKFMELVPYFREDVGGQSHRNMLAAGMRQIGNSKVYEGHGYLVKLLDDGAPLIYIKEDLHIYWGVNRREILHPEYKFDDITYPAYIERPIAFYHDYKNGERRGSYELSPGSSSSGNIEGMTEAQIEALRQTPLRQQLERAGLVADKDTADVFASVADRGTSDLMVTLEGSYLTLYLRASNSHWQDHTKNAKGPAIVRGIFDGSLVLDDGFLQYSINSRGFSRNRVLKQDAGTLIQKMIANGDRPLAIEGKTSSIVDSVSNSSKAITELKGNFREQGEKLLDKLKKDRRAQGNSSYQGNMANGALYYSDTKLGSLLERDDMTLKNLGFTKEQLGSLLGMLRKMTNFVTEFRWGGRGYHIRTDYGGSVIFVLDRETGRELEFRPAYADYVYEFGFFGDPRSAARLDPKKLVEFFHMK